MLHIFPLRKSRNGMTDILICENSILPYRSGQKALSERRKRDKADSELLAKR